MDSKSEEITVIKSPLGYERSPSIGKLSLALSKAQASMEAAIRDSDNPFFKSKYADLSSVWKACRKELTDNELSIIQLPIGKPPTIGLVTMLSHSSDQFIASSFYVETRSTSDIRINSVICRYWYYA